MAGKKSKATTTENTILDYRHEEAKRKSIPLVGMVHGYYELAKITFK
ncbi:MAG: hypothetical protein WC560_12030 [Syntrophales bacterium]